MDVLGSRMYPNRGRFVFVLNLFEGRPTLVPLSRGHLTRCGTRTRGHTTPLPDPKFLNPGCEHLLALSTRLSESEASVWVDDKGSDGMARPPGFHCDLSPSALGLSFEPDFKEQSAECSEITPQ